MTEKTGYATLRFAEWQRDRIDFMENFIENQFYGFFRRRILDYIKENNGLIENNFQDIAFKMENGKLNYFDWKMLYNTFLAMKKNGQFEEEHRGRGYPIIYTVKEAKP